MIRRRIFLLSSWIALPFDASPSSSRLFSLVRFSHPLSGFQSTPRYIFLCTSRHKGWFIWFLVFWYFVTFDIKQYFLLLPSPNLSLGHIFSRATSFEFVLSSFTRFLDCFLFNLFNNHSFFSFYFTFIFPFSCILLYFIFAPYLHKVVHCCFTSGFVYFSLPFIGQYYILHLPRTLFLPISVSLCSNFLSHDFIVIIWLFILFLFLLLF